MKFNQQLKNALIQYEKECSNKDAGRTVLSTRKDDVVENKKHENKSHGFFDERGSFRIARVGDRPTEKVAGGVVLWEPIDRAAAMLLAKAPWYSHPPPTTTPEPEPKPKKKKGKQPMSDIKTGFANNPAIDVNAQIVTNKSKSDIDIDLARRITKQAGQSIDQTGEILEKALDARAALDVMCDQWKVSWLDFMDAGDKRLREIRMYRMAMDTETRQLMSSLREVRSFFMDKDYSTEIARLKEFVEVCERLQQLKQSGFLDTVADTMLKLSK